MGSSIKHLSNNQYNFVFLIESFICSTFSLNAQNFGNAVKLNGSSNYITVPNVNNFLEPAAFTFECWSKRSTSVSQFGKDRIWMSINSGGWGVFIEGNLVCYYQNGTIQLEEFSNENGNLQGIQKYFYPNAQLRNQFQYEDGTLNGEQKQYYENGKIKREVFFENGKLIRQRCWDEKGIEMLFCK